MFVVFVARSLSVHQNNAALQFGETFMINWAALGDTMVASTDITDQMRKLTERRLIRQVYNGTKNMLRHRTTRISFTFLLILGFLAVFGPVLAPYPYDQPIFRGGELVRTAPPSIAHPFGTTQLGYDVFSRLLHGVRPTMITGVVGGMMIFTIGTSIGMTAGYMGGTVDNVLMRFTDLIYGVPLIPFALVLVGFTGAGFFQSVLVIGMVLWRAPARVIRAQTLQIKEREFVSVAKASGAPQWYIITKHIFPNVATMGIFYFAVGMGYSIIAQAGLAFLGVSNPFVPSWGIMVRNAYQSGYMITAWWWSISSGTLIALTVVATLLFGRGYEQITQDTDGEALAQAG